MDCPQCQTTNPPAAVRCSKCDTPLDASLTLADTASPSTPPTGETLAPDATVTPTPDPGAMKVAEGWSVPAPVSPTVAGSLANLQPGTLLGSRYEILKLLGQGGMGAVYQAKDRELDRMVALKVIRPELAGRPEILQRFKQELILARQVTHKNVIRIYDLGEADGVKFITMQFIEGQDLKTLLTQKGKFTVEEAVGIIQEVCLALEAAHAEGVVHRDLKPQNIMVDSQGRVSVMDFGIARSVELGGMTQTGALMGTPEYMSPEQVRGEHVDARSDLFTLGIIFCELLTGKMPYKADTVMSMMFKRTQERATPVVQLDPSVPKPVSDVVAKCLEIDPKLRYQSAAEIRQDLEAWVGTGTVFTARPLSLSLPPVRWLLDLPTPRKWIAAGVAVLLLAVGGFALRKLLVHVSLSPSATVQPVSLAILPFRNASGDAAMDWLGPALAEMLPTEVGQSAHLRIVSSDRLHQILRDLKISPDTDWDPSTLRRVAEFTNADQLIWGRYLKVGGQVQIEATLRDPKGQRTIPLQSEAPNEGEISRAVNALAKAIRQNLALPSEVLRDLQSKSITTFSKSPHALRDYSEGLQLARQGKHTEAVKSFESSVKEDPNFALAYAKLAQSYANLGYAGDAEKYARQAVELSRGLPTLEKNLVAASHARIVNDLDKAIESYRNLLKIWPDDPQLNFELAGIYEAKGLLEPAAKQYAKLLMRDPNDLEAIYRAGIVENRRRNYKGALDFLNRALSLAIQFDNRESKAAILHSMGSSYQGLSKPEDALRNFKEALAIRKQLGDKRGMAATLSEMGRTHGSIGKLDVARARYQEALKIQREMGDKRGMGFTLINLGRLLREAGQYEQALELAKEALQIELELGDENLQATCQNNIGALYFLKSQYEDALIHYQRALEIREKQKHPDQIATTLYNIGELFLYAGRYDQALKNYLRALDLWRETGDTHGVAYASYGLGMVFASQGRYGAALKVNEDALKNFQQLQDRSYWLGEILAGYGNALSLVGRLEEAQKPLEEALRLAHGLQNNALVARVLNLQGDRLFYREDLRGARALYQQALQVASNAKDHDSILLSRLNLAKAAIREGRAQAVVTGLKELAGKAASAGLKYRAAECSVYLGEALFGAKDYSRARLQLEAALQKSENLGARLLQAQSHYLLAKVLPWTGSKAGAGQHYRETLKILEEMRTETGTDTLLKRADLAPLYQESSGFAQNPSR